MKKNKTLRDLLVYTAKGLAQVEEAYQAQQGAAYDGAEDQIVRGLAFSASASAEPLEMEREIHRAVDLRDQILEETAPLESFGDEVYWEVPEEGLRGANGLYGTEGTYDEDVRSLRAITIEAVQGISGWLVQAEALGKRDEEARAFVVRALAAAARDETSVGDLLNLTLEAGKYAVAAMADLTEGRAAASDEANSAAEDSLSLYEGAIGGAIRSDALGRLIIMTGTLPGALGYSTLDRDPDEDMGRAAAASLYFRHFTSGLPEDTVLAAAGPLGKELDPEKLGHLYGADAFPRLFKEEEGAGLYTILLTLFRLRVLLSLEDVNDLPFELILSMEGGEGMAEFLAILAMGIRNFRIRPDIPAAFSPAVWDVYKDNFGLDVLGIPREDLSRMKLDYTLEEKAQALENMEGPVTKDMLISEIVMDHPEAVRALVSVGMHCIGCPSSQMETLSEACLVHGLNTADVLRKVNRAIIEA